MFRSQCDHTLAFQSACSELGAAVAQADGVSIRSLEQRALALIPGLVIDRKILASAIATGSRRLLRAAHACCSPDDWARFLGRYAAVHIPDDVSLALSQAFLRDLVRIGLTREVARLGPLIMLQRDSIELRDFLLLETPIKRDEIFLAALASVGKRGMPRIRALAGDIVTYLDHLAAQESSTLLHFMQAACFIDDHRFALLLLSTGHDFSRLVRFAQGSDFAALITRSSCAHGKLANQRIARNRSGLLDLPVGTRVSDIAHRELAD